MSKYFTFGLLEKILAEPLFDTNNYNSLVSISAQRSKFQKRFTFIGRNKRIFKLCKNLRKKLFPKIRSDNNNSDILFAYFSSKSNDIQ